MNPLLSIIIHRQLQRCVVVGSVLAVLMVVFAAETIGQENLSPSNPNGSGSDSALAGSRDNASICGITGHYRIGRWTAVRLTELDRDDDEPGTDRTDSDPVGPGTISIETLDGDGVRAVYQQPSLANDSGNARARYGYVIPGSEAAPVILRRGERVILSQRFPLLGSPSRGPSAVPPGMAWIVSLGDPLGVDAIGANDLLKRDAMIAVSQPTSATELPGQSLGYDGVDMIMINSAGYELLRDLEPSQSQAIVDWVRNGGRVFLTLGESAAQLPEVAPWLYDLLPKDTSKASGAMSSDGRVNQPEIIRLDPSAIETYTSAQMPLSAFEGMKLPRGVGEILLTGRTTRRVSTPLAAEYTVGLGRITVIAADLESDVFALWPERLDLIRRLTGSLLMINRKQEVAASRLTAFDDLAGQTRATLDQFSIKRHFSFSVLALVLMALIALIGPLDYLLINRALGKPLLGWLTFPVVALGLSAVLVSQSVTAMVSNKTEGSATTTVQCNRLEVIDIDMIDHVGRGFAWSFLYSHPANQFDIDVLPSEDLKSFSSSVGRIYTAPFGTPGQAFGGIQIEGEDSRLPPYEVVANRTDDQIRVTIEDLAIAPRSSKSIAIRLSFDPDLTEIPSIQRRRGSELLQGQLTNPLPVDLLDGMLIYGNWVYLLPTRLPPGGRIESLSDLRQKNFRWQLSRQQIFEKSKITNETWEPSNFDSPSRMAEMLMFHDAVGGSRYTGLRHQPLSFLDSSHLLTHDRCILMGRLGSSATEIRLRDIRNDDRQQTPSGMSLSMVRIVLPVETAQRK
ncbi:MAG: hypothetical protein HKN47_03280 [Pirellulaceae bacterium]|nr:hypothetical protein [Pirellulaceae bacterium]